MIEPTERFQQFARELVTAEHDRCLPPIPDILERRLWAAAQFDAFAATGQIMPMLDSLGLPVDEAMAYHEIIRAALDEIATASSK